MTGVTIDPPAPAPLLNVNEICPEWARLPIFYLALDDHSSPVGPGIDSSLLRNKSRSLSKQFGIDSFRPRRKKGCAER